MFSRKGHVLGFAVRLVDCGLVLGDGADRVETDFELPGSTGNVSDALARCVVGAGLCNRNFKYELLSTTINTSQIHMQSDSE